MKKTLFILILLTALGFGAYKFFFAKKQFISVLVFSKTEQFRHESIEAGKNAIMKLGQKHGFAVDTTEDASTFKEDYLKKYNVVIFLSTTGDVLNDAQQLEFNRFIQAGGGFVGIHAAADTEYDWPWYGKLTGAWFSSHPNDPNVLEADIHRVDSEHISTKMLPDEWHRFDEWYNYKDINPDINILLNLDETSYEGGTNGENHPIAWYHEFDGGRSWYTGLGHTDETFSEPLFLEHLWGGIRYASGPGQPVNYNNANVAPEENRFSKVILEDNLAEPMELEMLPDGKILFIERHGNVRVFDPAVDSSTVIQKMNVFSDLEDGLLGLALDPDFEENNWIYLFNSDPDESKQKISRFTIADDYYSIDMTSEKVLLEIVTQREECCHSGGSMEFGPGGLLYISTGDNTNPHVSDGFSPSDEGEGRMPWDAQKSSANTNDLRGKILRIKPEADGTYSIPEGNLFPEGTDQGRSEIYVMGCRNPFRISIDQHTGYLYWGDVGPDAGKDSLSRGPRGYDEVNQARKPGFFGWPYFIGDNKPYTKYDFVQQVSIDPFNAEKPINLSPNNTGAQELPPAQPAFIWYPYAASKEFPLVGDGGRNAMAGPVFYADDYADNDGRFPEYYDGKLFTYDWMRGWIMAVTMDEEGSFVRMERFLPSYKFSNPTDIIMGPNGDFYMLEYGTVWFSQNPDARLVRIQYTDGNRKPVAQIDTDKPVGATPLTVNFSSENARDFDGDELSYFWYFDESGQVSSTEANPTHTFEQPGTYKIRLVVTDPAGETAEATAEILAGNELPALSWKFQGNRTFYWDDMPLNYEVVINDKEDGSLGNGIDPQEVNISIDYLERGYDANESAMGHQALQEASTFLLGKRLMSQSDCTTCHQMDVVSVGPTYQSIAEKYAKDKNAVTYLAKKIIDGGGGVWGQIAMAAHPQLSTSEAEQMAKYILSLSNERAGLASSLPAQGTYTFNQHKAANLEGKYILTASYTDKGGQSIGSLTAREVITLRHPTVPINIYDGFEKVMKFTVDPEMSQGMVEEEMDILIGNNEGYAFYKNLDLTGVQSMSIDIAKGSNFFSGGKVIFRLNTPDGKVLSEFEVKTSLVDIGMETMQATVQPVEGIHDVYVTFENDGEKPVTALISFTFNNVPAS